MAFMPAFPWSTLWRIGRGNVKAASHSAVIHKRANTKAQEWNEHTGSQAGRFAKCGAILRWKLAAGIFR
jgi:hypothetical protein